MNFTEFMKPADNFLKKENFKKKGTCWNRISDNLVWVICFQKGKGASKTEFDLTVNIGVYVLGTQKLIFEDEAKSVVDAYCFFRKRPAFFGYDKEWWKVDLISDTSSMNQIQDLLKKVLVFFQQTNSFDKLVLQLPMDSWKSNTNFHSELLKVACGYLINGNQSEANNLLHVIASKNSVWAKKAESISQQLLL